MSWQIPTQVEQDIIAGKATYRTFQTGNGGQSILPVPANAYVVIFGYDFSPAGGGFRVQRTIPANSGSSLHDNFMQYFETQQISFYTGRDFYPFIHHCDVKSVIAPEVVDASLIDAQTTTIYGVTEEIDNTPIARQVYITSTNDVTITVGGIKVATQVTQNVIPVTNRTPLGLTYGGSPQAIRTQTDFGPGGNPLQFMQPSPKDYQDFAFGLLPANADGQAFATPDTGNGLVDFTWVWNNVIGSGTTSSAASQYYLNLHYALYNTQIPKTQG